MKWKNVLHVVVVDLLGLVVKVEMIHAMGT